MLVPPLGNRGAELASAGPQLAVGPVGRHDQVRGGQSGLAADVVLVADAHPELPGPGGEDVHAALPAHRVRVAVLATDLALAAEADDLVAPVDRPPLDLFCRLGVELGQPGQEPLFHGHAPAVRNAFFIPFEYGDVARRLPEFQQKRAVKPSRPPADADNSHGAPFMCLSYPDKSGKQLSTARAG